MERSVKLGKLRQNDKVEQRRVVVSSTLSFVLSSFSPLTSVVSSLPFSLNSQGRQIVHNASGLWLVLVESLIIQLGAG